MREDAEKTSGLLLVLALVFLGGLSGIWIWKKKARAGLHAHAAPTSMFCVINCKMQARTLSAQRYCAAVPRSA